MRPLPRSSVLSLPLYSTGQIKSQAQPKFKRWEGNFHLLMGGTAESFYRGHRYGNDGIIVAVSAFSPSLVSASLSCHPEHPAPCGAWGQAAAELCFCFSREWRRPSSACWASISELDSGPLHTGCGSAPAFPGDALSLCRPGEFTLPRSLGCFTFRAHQACIFISTYRTVVFFFSS